MAQKGRLFLLTLNCLVFSLARALEVEIPQKEYEFARGDNITLPCKFAAKNAVNKLVFVTWTVEGVKPGSAESVVLTHYYTSGTKTTDVTGKYEGRAQFVGDVTKGNGNLKLDSITLLDNKVFECRVQIPNDDTGKLADTTRLVVLVAPSTPVCKMVGKAEYGQNINLTCLSAEGSPAPTYKWQSRDVRNMPRAPQPRTTEMGGVLSLFNISIETSGYYTCTSTNKIRSASCNLTVTVMPPSMNIGSTAGIIGGVAAVLLILIIVICCCCRKKKKDDKEEYALGAPEGGVYDKEPLSNGEGPHDDRPEEVRSDDDYSVRSNSDRRERDYDDRRERDYDDRRERDYDDRRSDYDEGRSDYDERRSDYDDRRDRRERYDDDDDRRYDSRDRRDDRYDEPYDERERARPPSVPSNKPSRMDHNI